MSRKKLSVGGRVAAAGVSVAIAGALGGFMATRDHTAHATSSSDSAAVNAPSNPSATPFPRDQDGFDDDTGRFQPQPQTRTGGS